MLVERLCSEACRMTLVAAPLKIFLRVVEVGSAPRLSRTGALTQRPSRALTQSEERCLTIFSLR